MYKPFTGCAWATKGAASRELASKAILKRMAQILQFVTQPEEIDRMAVFLRSRLNIYWTVQFRAYLQSFKGVAAMHHKQLWTLRITLEREMYYLKFIPPS
jgi:hypothetical protein